MNLLDCVTQNTSIIRANLGAIRNNSNSAIAKACACFLASGAVGFLEDLKATELAAFPYTKGQFDGGISTVASQNNAGVLVAGRTLIVTNDLKSHVGDFQIDLICTLQQTIGTINANEVNTATVYGASSSAAFLVGNYTPIFTIDIRNGYVNSAGGAIQTVPTAAGPQFVQATDLGTSFFGNTFYGISGATTATQSQLFTDWLNTFSSGSNVAIGISFDLNANEGALSVGISNQTLDNNAIAFNSVLPNSLGFNIAPAIPEPTTPLLLLGAGIGLSLIRRREER